jgi:protein tyrosine/serine phosphatase
VYLDAALGAAVTEFGSIDRYLEIAAGLDAERREQLRGALLE